MNRDGWLGREGWEAMLRGLRWVAKLRGIGGLSGEGWLDEGKVSNLDGSVAYVGSATSFHGKLSGFVFRYSSKI